MSKFAELSAIANILHQSDSLHEACIKCSLEGISLDAYVDVNALTVENQKMSTTCQQAYNIISDKFTKEWLKLIK